MNLRANDKIVMKRGFWKGKIFKVMESHLFGLIFICSNRETLEEGDNFYCDWFWKWQLEKAEDGK